MERRIDIGMTELFAQNRERLAPLFFGTQNTMVLTCLQGHMGRAFADSADSPACAKILVGDFCLFAGDPGNRAALELVRHIPEEFSSPQLLAIPPTKRWGALIEQEYDGRLERLTRYAIKKEPDAFDPEQLSQFAARLPQGFSIVQIDRRLAMQCMEQDFSRDFCSQFDSPEDFVRRGLGYCALFDGRIVAGASSYTIFDGGIEIEVDTHPAFRRRGLAAACAAALILECLDRGWYPSWDAANLSSVALSEKLGYHLDYAYPAYAIKCLQKK